MSGAAYLWIEVESLQRVDDQRVLCQPVVHDHVEAVHEGRSLDNRLVVGIVEALEPDNAPLQHERRHKVQRKARKENGSQKRTSETLAEQMEECNAHLLALCRGDGRKKNLSAYDYTITSGVVSCRKIKSVTHF